MIISPQVGVTIGSGARPDGLAFNLDLDESEVGGAADALGAAVQLTGMTPS